MLIWTWHPLHDLFAVKQSQKQVQMLYILKCQESSIMSWFRAVKCKWVMCEGKNISNYLCSNSKKHKHLAMGRFQCTNAPILKATVSIILEKILGDRCRNTCERCKCLASWNCNSLSVKVTIIQEQMLNEPSKCKRAVSCAWANTNATKVLTIWE